MCTKSKNSTHIRELYRSLRKAYLGFFIADNTVVPYIESLSKTLIEYTNEEMAAVRFFIECMLCAQSNTGYNYRNSQVLFFNWKLFVHIAAYPAKAVRYTTFTYVIGNWRNTGQCNLQQMLTLGTKDRRNNERITPNENIA